ncbi:hypothetical protein KW805_00460 [Candidatus Pacearchaeota archaeon]|nr:hypothetical protein [Candidatus Pacearchaeota archaeon]
MSKRGLSDVVTTVLIILLVLAAIVIVWKFTAPSIRSAGEQVETNSLTAVLVVVSKSISDNTSTSNISFIVKKNAGSEEVVGFDVILEDASGNTKKFTNYESTALKAFETARVSVNYTSLSSIKKILLVPLVKNSQTGKIITGKIPSITTVSSGTGTGSSSGGGGSPSVCGNGVREGNEVCDGGSQSCTTTGGYSGTQTCKSDCTGYNSCTTTQRCGDGVVNGPEVCDYSGTISCTGIDQGTGLSFTGTKACLSCTSETDCNPPGSG